MNMYPTPAAADQPRARSSAQTDWQESGQAPVSSELPPGGGRQGEQEAPTDLVSRSRKTGEQDGPIGPVSKDWNAGEQEVLTDPVSIAMGGQVISLSAHRQSCSPVSSPVKPFESTPADLLTSEPMAGEQASQWIKSILPDASSGWWDVRFEGNGFVLKFRWRSPNQQSLTFPRLTGGQFQALRESARDQARIVFREQITQHLRALLLNPAKRGKAQDVALRLGIDLDDDRAVGANTRQAINF